MLQMQPTECGVVSLAMLLAHHGRWVRTAEIREVAGLDGNGLTIAGIVRCAEHFGLDSHIWRCTPETLSGHPVPLIGWWERRHFLVIEGRGRGGWWVNDPAAGHRLVPDAEFEEKFSGLVVECSPTDRFERGGRPPSGLRSCLRLLAGAPLAATACVLASLAIVPLNLGIAGFLTFFVDRVLENPSPQIVHPFLLAVGVVLFIRASLSLIRSQSELRIRTAAGLQLQMKLFERCVALPDRELTLRLPGDVQQRLSLPASIAGKVTHAVLAVPGQVVSALVFGTAIALITPAVLVAVLVAMVLGGIIVRGVNRLIFELSTRFQVAMSTQRATMFSGLASQAWLHETGGVSGFIDRWTGELAEARTLAQRLAQAKLFASSGRTFLSHVVSQVLTLVFGGLAVIAGSVTVGELAALQLLVGHLQGDISGLLGFAQSVPGIRADLARVEDITTVAPRSEDLAWEVDEDSDRSGIEFVDLPVAGDRKVSGAVPLGEVGRIDGVPDRALSSLAQRLAGRVRGEGVVRWHGDAGSEHRVPARCRIVDGRFPLLPGTYRSNLTGDDPRVSNDDLWTALVAAGLQSRFNAMPLGPYAPVNPNDGFQSAEDRFRLEVASILADPPAFVIVAGGLSSVPLEDARSLVDAIEATGASTLILEPGLESLERGRSITIESTGTGEATT